MKMKMIPLSTIKTKCTLTKKLPSIGVCVTFLIVFTVLCILDETSLPPLVSSLWTPPMFFESHSPPQDRRQNERAVNHPYQKQKKDDSPACTILPPTIVPHHKVESTFLASYPGSGSKLSWQLTQALTGMITTDDVFSNGVRNAVAIKTHYPAKEGTEALGSEMIKRLVLFVRHPREAMIAYHDFIYASNRNQKSSNSLDHWIRWRDENFEEQIQIWRKHLEYWMDRYAEHSRMIVPYEQIISELHGPTLSTKLAEFLSRNQGVTTVKPEDIPCIWKTIVQSSFGSNGLRRRRRLSSLRGATGIATATTNNDNDIDNTNIIITQHRQLQSTTQTQQEKPQRQQTPQSKQSQQNQQPQQPQRLPNTNIMMSSSATMIDVYSRPFVETQIKEMVIALAQLLEKYRDDKVLAPILVEYIDQVTVNANKNGNIQFT